MNNYNSKSNSELNYIERLSITKRIIASAGAIPSCIDMLMIQTFLLYYYTDVLKINAAFAGALFLVTRIIAAFAAPIFGIYVDQTSTPWGKYKPYYLIFGIPTAVLGFLTFTSVGMEDSTKYIYVSLTYFAYNLFISLGGVPKGAMGPAMTKSMDDRVSLGLMGYIFSVVGSLLVVSLGPVLIRVFGGGNEARGFSLTMAMFGTVSIFIAFLQWIFLEERYVKREKASSSKYPFKLLLSAVFHNNNAVIVLLTTLSMNLANGLRMAVTMHYLKYHFHRPELMAQFGLLSMICLFAGAFLSSKVTKYIGIKNILIVSYLFTIASFALMYPINGQSIGVIFYLILSMVNNFFNGLSSPAQSTLMPNAIDYCEWKTGMNVGAFMSSINTFVSTAATAIAGVLVGAVLSLSGYQPDVEQTQSSLQGIRILMSLAPAVACIISLSVIRLDNTEKEHEIIVKELMER